MVKLTKRTIDALEPPLPGCPDLVIFDDALPGFGIRMKPSGAISFMVQYRNQHRQSRRITLGKYGVLTPDEARKHARQMLAAVATGADPAAERKAVRKAITVAALCDEYLEINKGRVKEGTTHMDRCRIECHVKPLLGNRPVASLTAADMERFLQDVMNGKTASGKRSANDGTKRGGRTRGGPGVAARALSMLGTILQRAVRDEILPKNPVHGIRRPKGKIKHPPFSFEAVEAVGLALRELEALGDQAVGFRVIRFLLLTGCRRMEALTLKWGIVDKRVQCLRFPDTKTGAQIRPIGAAALRDLETWLPQDAEADHYVFPSNLTTEYFVGLPRVWQRVCARAKITGVSIHGLRHWFATAATELNFSELTIAGLLGHHVRGVTARYANAPDSALVSAANRVSEKLADSLDGRTTTNVVNLRV